MKNITFNGIKKVTNLNKEISLTNGSLVLLKDGGTVKDVFMVVSFRDNKTRYHGDPTTKYCSLVNLDTGYFPFEERCSRNTTVRRVLNHLLRLGSRSYEYNEPIPVSEYGDHDIEIYYNGKYEIDISTN